MLSWKESFSPFSTFRENATGDVVRKTEDLIHHDTFQVLALALAEVVVAWVISDLVKRFCDRAAGKSLNRGIVTFLYGEDVTEYMSLYTAEGFEGEAIPCDEGELEWVEKKKIQELDIWEGDKIFFRLLEEGYPFFSLKLVYDSKATLLYAALDGKQMELDVQTDR